MNAFSPDEMEVYGREAIRPYLELRSVLDRDGYNYGSNTTLFKSIRSSVDMNWAVGTMVLEFRNGRMIVKSELWQCYEGEGAEGLDEKWELGTVFSQGNESQDFSLDLLTYRHESEALLEVPLEFTQKIRAFEELFKKHLAKYSKPFPVEESTVPEAPAEIDMDKLVDSALPLETYFPTVEAGVTDGFVRYGLLRRYACQGSGSHLGNLAVYACNNDNGSLSYSVSWRVGHHGGLDLHYSTPLATSGVEAQQKLVDATKSLVADIDSITLKTEIDENDLGSYARFLRKIHWAIEDMQKEFFPDDVKI